MPLSEFQLSEGRYNARDVLATCRIYAPLAEAIARTNTLQVYQYDREMAKLALQMRRRGMPIDNEERERVGNHLREIRDAATEELKQYVTKPEFFEWLATYQAVKPRKGDPQAGQMDAHGLSESKESAYAARIKIRREEIESKRNRLLARGKDIVSFRSKYQQAAILRCAGVLLTRLSPKLGIPKISKETLEAHAHNPAARAMLNFGITASIIKTFVEGLNVDADGWLHPDWLIHKITGRWGSEPNVQNWSVRAGGGAENLRRMVRAPQGFVFVGADFAQLEARILAYLSRDPLLLEIFSQGRDIHAEMAQVGYPTIWPKMEAVYQTHAKERESCACQECKGRKKLRDMVKRLEYGAFYGGAPQVLWQAVVKDVPSLLLRDVENFIRAINTRMPALLRWRQAVLKDVMLTREVRSPFLGRRQVFPLGRVDPGVAYNYKAQSGGADLWAMGAVEFQRNGFEQTSNRARIIHNGHDSVLVLAEEKRAEEVADCVRRSWERTIDGVPFKMDVKIGERWSEV